MSIKHLNKKKSKKKRKEENKSYFIGQILMEHSTNVYAIWYAC